MSDDNKGWRGESERHAEAAKGKSASTSSNGQGWHGDSKGHAKAAKGEEVNSEGILDKLKSE